MRFSLNRKHSYEDLRKDRDKNVLLDKLYWTSPMEKYRGPAGWSAKRDKVMQMARNAFGQHVRENFNPDTLAMMSLIQGEPCTYEVHWLDAGLRPALSALLLVRVLRQTTKQQNDNLFLLYRVNGRVLVARVLPDDRITTVSEAWACQIPAKVLLAVATLREQGYTFRSDLEGQAMLVYAPDGSEARREPWTGQTVDG